MTGNIADGTRPHKKYDGSATTYGFYLVRPVLRSFPFTSFSKNQAYDSEYGFYSDEEGSAARATSPSGTSTTPYDVEITG